MNTPEKEIMTIAQQLKIVEFPFKIKDSKGNLIYWEDSDGDWIKSERDSKGNLIYYENSNGEIIEYHPKTNQKSNKRKSN